jgi:hypothetical protein
MLVTFVAKVTDGMCSSALFNVPFDASFLDSVRGVLLTIRLWLHTSKACYRRRGGAIMLSRSFQ